MTINKLSFNQDLQIKTSSMQLNYAKNRANDFSNRIALTDSAISIPNLCNSINLCSNSLITSQVMLILNVLVELLITKKTLTEPLSFNLDHL